MAGRSVRGSRRGVIAAAIVVLALVVGVFLVRSSIGAPSASGREDSASTAPSRSTDASGDSAGTSVGVGSDQGSAVAAAVAYATASQGWLYLSDDDIRAAISEIATPAAAEGLADDVVADVSKARGELARASGPIWWFVRPLAWRVESFRDTEARVSVWIVAILSAAGVAAPQSDFMTITLDLEQVDGAWLVDDVRSTSGPTPITGPNDQPWDAEPFDDALDGFHRIDVVS